jgi:hypothetical protein
MSEAVPASHRSNPVCCVLCGDVIGVYERMVEQVGEEIAVTSRAAQPQLSPRAGAAYYHATCFEDRAS